jgi:predicted DNA-binding transcriptional regulator AlpA
MMTTGSAAGASSATPAEEQHMAIDEVCTYAGGKAKPLHRNTIRDWIRTRGFPEPIKLGPNTARWKRSEIDAWIEAQRP